MAEWAAESPTNAALASEDTQAMAEVFEIMQNAERSAYGTSGEQVNADIVRGMLMYNAKRGDIEARKALMREDGKTEEEIQNAIQHGEYSPTKLPGTMGQLGESLKEGSVDVARGVAGALVGFADNMQGQTVEQ